MKRFCLFFLFLVCLNVAFSQRQLDSLRIKNEGLLHQLEELIKVNGSFKAAVFLSEQGFENKVTRFNYYYDFIKSYTELVQAYFPTLRAPAYRQSDSLNYLWNLALFDIFTNFIPIKKDTLGGSTLPFSYNFDDPQGDKDFGSTFVTRLLATHQGNCRSLTYLYKILADELGVKCWLALAPNHIYIRNYSKQVGWYNTELTSGTFPTDAWIAATGYISADAVRSGVYMDTLSNQQGIGLCILDLLHGYIKQTGNYTDGLVLRGCNLVLQYHPINPMALLLKAEALKQGYGKQKAAGDGMASATFTEMESVYAQLLKTGYREMPYEVYQKWLRTVNDDKRAHLQQSK